MGFRLMSDPIDSGNEERGRNYLNGTDPAPRRDGRSGGAEIEWWRLGKKGTTGLVDLRRSRRSRPTP